MLDLNTPKEERIWTGPSAEEVGFNLVQFPKLRRKRVDCQEYLVYSDENEFKLVEADTVFLAMEKSEIETPLKVIPAHKRIDDVLASEDLECSDDLVADEQQADEASGDSEATEENVPAEEAPPTEEPPPAE